MTTTQAAVAHTDTSAPEVPAGRTAPVRAMALALWVVVGSLLAYGIAQTVVKASALFA